MLKFFFTLGAQRQLVAFSDTTGAFALKDCMQGQNQAAVQAASSPLFPATAEYLDASCLQTVLQQRLERYPKVRDIALGHSGMGVLMRRPRIGRSELSRTADHRCFVVAVSNPE